MQEQEKNIEQIIANERSLRLLIDNTDDPIWLVDTSYKIIECNRAFKRWVNWFIGRELGRGDHVLFSGQNRSYQEKFEMCYNLAMNGRTFRTVEDMVVNNETRYTTVSFNPVFDKARKVTGVSCFARDITEQRKQLFRIEEQNAALREIAFIESHKVRGPVATIMGLEQFFNYTDLADPANREIMEGISQMTKELDEMIREVVRKSNDIGL